MMDRRLQILLDERRYQKVVREAERRGTSIAMVIREAIDRLPDDCEARRGAIRAVLAAEPMEVPPDPSELRREMDAVHGRAGT